MRRPKNLLFSLLAAGVALGALVGCRKQTAAPAAPPVPVITAEVLVRDQPIHVENIGQTLGAQDVEIRARVAGFLESVNFIEGRFVTNGALLYTIDNAPFKASLAQARGVLAQADVSWQKAGGRPSEPGADCAPRPVRPREGALAECGRRARRGARGSKLSDFRFRTSDFAATSCAGGARLCRALQSSGC
jgi:hypothetical protein